MNNTDQLNVIEVLRGYGYAELDIMSVVEALEAGDVSLSDVADFVQAMDEGDDDEAYMCAAQLGLI